MGSDIPTILQSFHNYKDCSNTVEIVRVEGASTASRKSWASMLQVLALSSVLKRKITSVFPDVPHYARPLYHGVVLPQETENTINITDQQNFTNLVILWSRETFDNTPGMVYTPNHVVPLISTETSNENDNAVHKTPETEMEVPNEPNAPAQSINDEVHPFFNLGKPIPLKPCSSLKNWLTQKVECDKGHKAKFISAKSRLKAYPMFHEDGGKLFCSVCNIVLDHTRKSSLDDHLKCKRHTKHLEYKEKHTENEVKKQTTVKTSFKGKTGAAEARNEVLHEYENDSLQLAKSPIHNYIGYI